MARGPLAVIVPLVLLCAVAVASDPLNLWLDIPFVKQDKNGCGPASIAMVMQYWQKQPGMSVPAAPDLDAVVRTLQPDDRQGVRASAMAHYFERNGYRAFVFTGAWGDLERELAKGRPVIAALKPETGNSLHYVVVAGIDDSERVVLLNDPAQRKLLKEDRAQFEREWKVTGFWTLLAVPAMAQ